MHTLSRMDPVQSPLASVLFNRVCVLDPPPVRYRFMHLLWALGALQLVAQALTVLLVASGLMLVSLRALCPEWIKWWRYVAARPRCCAVL
jgi:hypothetical protein